MRLYGVSLFASAGVAGLVAGLAARPLLSNLFAGIQIAMTQPIHLDDGVLVENEFGRVEEITSTYVVIRLWDLRRLVVPLAYFIEKPFQNWSRESTACTERCSLHVDYTAPVERIREKAPEIVQASALWDGRDVKLQVTEARESTLELRVVASARTSRTRSSCAANCAKSSSTSCSARSRPRCRAPAARRRVRHAGRAAEHRRISPKARAAGDTQSPTKSLPNRAIFDIFVPATPDPSDHNGLADGRPFRTHWVLQLLAGRR